MARDDWSKYLVDRERILTAAWMLPNDGALNETQRRQAMDNFVGYCHRNKIELADAARQMGTPTIGRIRSLLAGVCGVDVDECVRKINCWVEQHARAQVATLGESFVTTRVANDVMIVAKLVRENRTMGLVIGPTGIGKSRCAQAIAEMYVGAVLIRVMTENETPRGIAHALDIKIGASRQYRNPQATRLERLIAVLQDSGRLIVVDEAHRLRQGAIEVLRDIHDVAGVPVLLIGTKDLQDRLLKNVDADHGQIYSRFDIVKHLTQGLDVYGGGKPLFTVADIKALYEITPIRLSTDATRYLQDVANALGHGSLRRCKILLMNAVRRSRKRQDLTDDAPVTVTADDLEWVERKLRQEAGEVDSLVTRKHLSGGTSKAV